MKIINFKSEISFKEINPENAILLFLAISGLTLSVLIFCLINIPLINNNKSLNEEIKIAKTKKDQINNLKQNLKDINNKINTQNNNRSLLLNLIGGTKNLDTFLAKLNETANKHQIKIMKFEPEKTVIFKDILLNNADNSINTSQNSQNNNFNNQKNSDRSNQPFYAPELEKHLVNIKLEGNFQEVLNFIRDVELLENIVLIEDFQISRLKDVNDSDTSDILYKANFSAFGKIDLNKTKID